MLKAGGATGDKPWHKTREIGNHLSELQQFIGPNHDSSRFNGFVIF